MSEVIGYLAGFLATVAFLPQVTKTVRDRSVKDISLGMYVLFCAGVGLWLLYGLLISHGRSHIESGHAGIIGDCAGIENKTRLTRPSTSQTLN